MNIKPILCSQRAIFVCDTLHAKRAGHPADVCTYCVRFKGVLKATQLNSTDPVEQRTAKSVVFLFMTSPPTNWVNWVTTFIDMWQLFTLWTSSWVELYRYRHFANSTQLNSTSPPLKTPWENYVLQSIQLHLWLRCCCSFTNSIMSSFECVMSDVLSIYTCRFNL